MEVELIQRIARIPLFEGLPQDQQRDLANIALEKIFERGLYGFFRRSTCERFLCGNGRKSEDLQDFTGR